MEERKNNFMKIIAGICFVLVGGAVLYVTQIDRNQNAADTAVVPEEPQVSAAENSKVRAKLVAQFLVDRNFELTRFVPAQPARNMASVDEAAKAVTVKVDEGEYGRDAWGRPFEFKAYPDKVVIWSVGENAKLDSPKEEIAAGKASGDDIVIIHTR